jgi:hypothetical protein
MLRRALCVLAISLGMTVGLAAPGGAAPKPPTGANSVTCSVSAGTTFTWRSDVTSVHYEFDRSDGTPTGMIGSFSTKKLSDSFTMTTPPDAVTVQPLFVMKSGLVGKPPATSCTA